MPSWAPGRVDAGTFDYWKHKLRFTPTLHTGKKTLKTLEKIKNLYFEHFLQLKSLTCTRFAGFGNLNVQFALDLRPLGLESLSFICS